MQKKSKLWQAFLAVSVAALTVPSFAYSGSDSTLAPGAGTSSSAGMPADADKTASPSASMPADADAAKAAASDEAKTDTDRSLNTNIRQALSGDAMLASSAKDIQLKTEEGEVTVEGSVFNKDAKEMIEEKIKKVQGVKDVNNDLKVASTDTPSAGGSMGSSGGMGSSGSGGMSGSAGGGSIPTR